MPTGSLVWVMRESSALRWPEGSFQQRGNPLCRPEVSCPCPVPLGVAVVNYSAATTPMCFQAAIRRDDGHRRGSAGGSRLVVGHSVNVSPADEAAAAPAKLTVLTLYS